MPDVVYECCYCGKLDSSKGLFKTSSFNEFQRHVAIDHCDGAHSTFRCGHCEKKFYDDEHFQAHLDSTPTCSPIMVAKEDLVLEENEFNDLVAQMLRRQALQSSTPSQVSLPEGTPSFQVCKVEIITLDDDEDWSRASKSHSSTDSNLPLAQLASTNSRPFGQIKRESDEPAVGEEREPDDPQLGQIKREPEDPDTGVSSSLGPMKTVGRKENAPPAKTTPTSKGTTSKSTGPGRGRGRGRSTAGSTTAASKSPGPSRASRAKRTSNANANVLAEETFEDRRCKRNRVSYRDASSSGGEDGESLKDEEEDDENGNDKDIGADNDKDQTGDDCDQALLDLCQLCIELENGPEPAVLRSQKDAHAIAHLKLAPEFEFMSDRNVRRREEFQKQLRCCFEEGFYEQVKRQFQLDHANGDDSLANGHEDDTAINGNGGDGDGDDAINGVGGDEPMETDKSESELEEEEENEEEDD